MGLGLGDLGLASFGFLGQIVLAISGAGLAPSYREEGEGGELRGVCLYILSKHWVSDQERV